MESFDDFIGSLPVDKERVQALTAKFVIAASITEQMQRLGVTKTALAQRMGTSRAVVHRLLDEQDTSLTLATLVRACTALEMQLDFGALLLAADAQDAPEVQDAASAARKAPARRMARTRRAKVPA